MRLGIRSSALVICTALVLSGTAQAAPITFIGSDSGATSLATAPNSVAAAAAFNAAASALGPISIINLDSNALGSLAVSTALNSQVSAQGATSSITNTTACGFNLCGGSTSGSNYISVFGGNITFSFTNPINFFGAYLSGLQGNIVGQQTLTYASGGTQTINIPMMTGGAAFVGFTDATGSIVSVTYSFFGDIVGIDDITYGSNAPSSVPELSSLSFLGFGLVALAAFHRRMRNRSQN